MSKTTSSGARKPNVAGLPMLSLRMRAPSSSIRAASSTTGPRTSYRTLSSLSDFLNCRMGVSPWMSLLTVVTGADALAGDAVVGLGVAGATPGPLARAGGTGLAAGTRPTLGVESLVGTPASQAASTRSRSARSAMTSRRGVTLPLTYWLTCDFPSLAPFSAAIRTRSDCLMPAASIVAASLSLNELPDMRASFQSCDCPGGGC